MKSSNDVTVTDARMKDVLKKQVVPLVMESVSPVITREVETAKLRTGVVTKFYPYLDKAEVELDNSNLKVLCRLPHKFGGALIDFFTPAGDEDFCEDFKEPCIVLIAFETSSSLNFPVCISFKDLLISLTALFLFLASIPE